MITVLTSELTILDDQQRIRDTIQWFERIMGKEIDRVIDYFLREFLSNTVGSKLPKDFKLSKFALLDLRQFCQDGLVALDMGHQLVGREWTVNDCGQHIKLLILGYCRGYLERSKEEHIR